MLLLPVLSMMIVNWMPICHDQGTLTQVIQFAYDCVERHPTVLNVVVREIDAAVLISVDQQAMLGPNEFEPAEYTTDCHYRLEDRTLHVSEDA